MTEFLHGDSLSRGIRDILKGENPRCAVAFLGRGASTNFAFPRGAQVYCNLTMGGTNPEAVRELFAAGCMVKQVERLHAKVYVSTRGAIVSSANLSTNGMGAEGRNAGWIEAGVFTSEVAPIESWLDTLHASEISEDDLKAAEVSWRVRSARPFVGLAEMEEWMAGSLLTSWWTAATGQHDKDAIRRVIGTTVPVEDVEDWSFDIASDDNKEALRGRWIWLFKRLGGGRTTVESGYWSYAELEVPGGYIDDDNSRRPIWLNISFRNQQPILFSNRDKRILADLANSPKYSSLLDEDWMRWFTEERLALMRQFWLDARARAVASPAS